MEVHMTLPLTEEQVRAVSARPDEPIRLIDPTTKAVFVLLRAVDYERLRTVLDDDYDSRDAYAAQFASAMRAGWDDPAMDDYNNYDEAFRKLCQ